MIPKIIHYCWFGGKELPKEVQKCINSWKKFCPDYKIIRWDESNYDVYKNPYTRYCFENKKWAFLSDYARLDIVYSHGGIYLDTDVEIIKSWDPLLKNECFLGMEQPGCINTGLGFGAKKGNNYIKENKEYYEITPFLKKNNKWIKTTCVKITSKLLVNEGLTAENKTQTIKNIVIYPTNFFCPKVIGTNKINITDNTYSIHHYDASWKSNSKILRRISYFLIPIKSTIKKIIGIK